MWPPPDEDSPPELLLDEPELDALEALDEEEDDEEEDEPPEVELDVEPPLVEVEPPLVEEVEVDEMPPLEVEAVKITLPLDPPPKKPPLKKPPPKPPPPPLDPPMITGGGAPPPDSATSMGGRGAAG